jgi:hypothetical protein
MLTPFNCHLSTSISHQYFASGLQLENFLLETSSCILFSLQIQVGLVELCNGALQSVKELLWKLTVSL